LQLDVPSLSYLIFQEEREEERIVEEEMKTESHGRSERHFTWEGRKSFISE
jgi:hypothetical protein